MRCWDGREVTRHPVAVVLVLVGRGRALPSLPLPPSFEAVEECVG